jgi:hypothetical protein
VRSEHGSPSKARTVALAAKAHVAAIVLRLDVDGRTQVIQPARIAVVLPS